jgi:ribosomal protein S18 acetylase RimI-like enzyme
VIAFVSQTDPNEAYIHFVGVHPGYRAAGVGRLLYEQVIATAVERGCTRLRCVTAPTNTRFIAFHQRTGFAMVPSATQQGELFVHRDYDGPGEDRVVFVKTLG